IAGNLYPRSVIPIVMLLGLSRGRVARPIAKRRAEPLGREVTGQMPVDKAKVLLTKPTCHPERSRITRKAHDPAKSKDPYPIHSATSTARRFLTPGNASIVEATSPKARSRAPPAVSVQRLKSIRVVLPRD